MHKLNKTGIIVLKHKSLMLESTAHVLKVGLKLVNVSNKSIHVSLLLGSSMYACVTTCGSAADTHQHARMRGTKNPACPLILVHRLTPGAVV